MLTEPVLEHRNEQLYVAIRSEVDMSEIPSALPPLIPEVFSWLNKNNGTPAGPPFFRYLSCNPGNRFVVEVGVPVAKAITGDDRVQSGSFPAGRYAKVTHLGSYNHLKEAHMFLETWGKENGIQYKQSVSDGSISWGSRTEFYVTDWKEEPDPDKWQTDVLFLVGGE